MEKLLAMSILSFATTDMSAEGWMKAWLKKENESKKETTMRKVDRENEPLVKVKKNEQQQRRIRFAQEFDGLDFFETLVTR
ncbi:hypothetical protein QJS04_geneDACA018748 [Acorus gramineus]|uniref:Uncharacterized protein n=1 Tax=Acorus gramineus TaxID=55184 RepID=A0AAV9ABH6_ACOGR|nr:hypothetical protein QJS04_geneDACA018748 [Acorus gramineus]